MLTPTHLLLALAAASSLSCAHFPMISRETGTLKGVVLSNFDFKPVVGARIMLDKSNRPQISATDGSFVFGKVAVGEHRLVVDAVGFFQAEAIPVPVLADESTCSLLLPQPNLGRVSDVITGPNIGPMLIVDGVIRFGALQLALPPPPPPSPGGVIQIRNWPLPPIPSHNIASVEFVRADAAARLYGQRAAQGAIEVTTLRHARC